MIPINPQIKGSLYLIACAFVWGMAFVAQGSAMDYVEPATFVAVRFTITFLALTAAAPLFTRIAGGRPGSEPPLKRHIGVGAVIGVVLGVASMLQQYGLVHTSPTNSGFVTALYILIVPVMGLFMGQRVRPVVWAGVALSVTGLLAEYLVRKKVRGVGIDTLSIGGWYEGTGRPCHEILLSHEIWALEEVVFPDELMKHKTCYLSAYPLKLQGFSGSMVRAVAVVEE